jgi:hypothetical protein
MGKHPNSRNTAEKSESEFGIYNVLAFGTFQQIKKRHNEDQGGNIGNYTVNQAIKSLEQPMAKWWEL